MRDRHVIRVLNGLIDGLTGDTQLPLRTGEGVINLTPSGVVGDFMMDVHAHISSASASHSRRKQQAYELTALSTPVCVLVSGKTFEGKSIAQHGNASPSAPLASTVGVSSQMARQ
jgi:hypothetical protein